MDKVKTMDGWKAAADTSRDKYAFDWDDYCKYGDKVSEDVIEYFRNVMPPVCDWSSLVQMGSPYDHVVDPENGASKAIFATFAKEDGGWCYKGHCFVRESEPLPEVAPVIGPTGFRAAFKSDLNFKAFPDEVCYIPENHDLEVDGTGYSRNDIVELCGGDEVLAGVVFGLCDWQAPSTVLDELDEEDLAAVEELRNERKPSLETLVKDAEAVKGGSDRGKEVGEQER